MRSLTAPKLLTDVLLIVLGALLIGGAGTAYASEPPVVTSVTPNIAKGSGKVLVTIRGSGFTGTSAVDFGTAPAALHTIHPTEMSVTAPAGSGTVDVTVTTPEGTSATGPNDLFSYTPVVTKVSPTSGPVTGGTPVTITGAGLGEASAVHFGSAAASSFTVVSPTSIKVTAPPTSAVAGVTDVTVTTPTGTSPAKTDKFKYLPVVSELNPSTGPTGGGTPVTVHGAGFALGSATTFMFGFYTSPSVNCVSRTECHVTSPTVPNQHKDLNVKATVNGLKSPSNPFVGFRYVPPTVVYLVEELSFNRLPVGAKVQISLELEGPAGTECRVLADGVVRATGGPSAEVATSAITASSCSGGPEQQLYGDWAPGGSFNVEVDYLGFARVNGSHGRLGVVQPEGECSYETETLAGEYSGSLQAEVSGVLGPREEQPGCSGSLALHGLVTVSTARGEIIVQRVG